MKIKKENLSKLCEILRKIHCNFSDSALFFPVEMTETYIDEFGMPAAKYKAETFYGNQLLPGVMQTEKVELDKNDYVYVNKAFLTYAQTTEVFSFNLAGYLDIIPQPELTDEDKRFLLQYESCLVRTDHTISDKTDLFDIY